MNKKSQETQYQWIKDEIKYTLLRPDTLIGSVIRQNMDTYVFGEDGKLKEQKVVSTPGLFQIFNEIVSNSVDEHIRTGNISLIKIKLNTKTGEIIVRDNGGITVSKLDGEDIYIPDMIVSKLRAGSNFDDTEDRAVAGRNGVGASITNIFSKQFSIKTADTKKQFYRQYKNNLSWKSEIKITDSADHFTEIRFIPDYERFEYTKIDSALIDLIRYKILTLASCNPKLKIVLDIDGTKEKHYFKSFKSFSELFNSKVDDTVYEESEDWAVSVKLAHKGFKHISFVNSLETPKGGEHVKYITNQITEWLKDKIKRKFKVNITEHAIKQHLFLLINAKIINPAFDQQTKTELVTKPSAFKTEHKISDRFLNKLFKSEILEQIILWAKRKEEDDKNRKIRQENRKLKNVKVEKLIDAKNKDRTHCTLLISEGDSAAQGGIKYRDPKIHGLFPLRGKVKNVKKILPADVYKNKELKNLMAAIGLKIGEKATDLRYNRIHLMMDSDTDGDAIAGLLLNFFFEFWPELFDEGKIFKVLTPVVVVKHKKETIEFYTDTEFNAWMSTKEKSELKRWDISFKKGLAALEAKECKKIIQDPKLLQIKNNDDSFTYLDIWFGRGSDKRKEAIVNSKVEEIIYSDDTKTIKDFLQEEYLSYAYHVIEQRAIPSMIDGFKPTQRKVINESRISWKSPNGKELKVFMLAGKIAFSQHYHHGNVSLEGAIVNMAQGFKNNLPLLQEIGQYGSLRSQEAGASRYISTRISENFNLVYKDHDLLIPTFDEGDEIEPKFFLPILPMVLINGSSGIAVGFATNILNRNPKDILRACFDVLDGKKINDNRIKPFFPDFTNNIQTKFNEDDARWVFSGKFERVNSNTLKITELPPNWEYESYEKHLNSLIDKNKIKDYDNNSKERIEYVIKFARKDLSRLTDKQIIRLLKLQSYGTENLNALDEHGKLKHFEKPSEIIKYFVDFRLPFYDKRKALQIQTLSNKILKTSNRVNFIMGIIKDTIKIKKVAKQKIVEQLVSKGFDMIDDSYDYLLRMAIHSLTKETLLLLKDNLKELKEELKRIKKLKAKDMYISDLKELQSKLK